jgi:hypothetical protein
MLHRLQNRTASGIHSGGPFLARQGLTTCLLAATLALPSASAAQGPEEVTEILNRFAEDYRTDPTLTESTVFGVRVDGRWWTVTARPPSSDSPAEVVVSRGEPQEPTFFFFLDGETLRRLDRGELNARTALGKARHSDVSPMDIDPTHSDVIWDEAFNRRVDAAANHFWLRGTPEFLVFNRDASRVLHGANAVLLHYVQGLRSVWYQVETGQHINPDRRDQANPFPSLFIFLHGNAKARIDGVELDVAGGTATLVPAGVSHEFWNPFGEPFEFILIMFGEGA